MKPLVLLAILLAVPSKGPVPTPAKAGQAKQEQTRGAQEQTKTDDQSAKKPVPAVPQSSPEITVGYEQRFGNQDKNSSPWRDWPAWAVAVFTLGLLIVAVLQWIAMHGQRKLMSDQLDSMKTTGDDTHALAVAAKEQAMASKETAMAANHTATAAMHQAEAMLVQAKALIMSAEAARESAETTRRMLEAYERPWVTATITSKDGLSFDANGNLHATFDYTVVNIGKSAATDIRAESQARAVPNGTSKNELKSILCAIENPSGFVGFTLFPPDRHSMLWPVEMSRDEISEVSFEAGDHIYFTMVILVAIFYRFPTSDSWHETRFGYVVGRGWLKDRLTVRRNFVHPPSELEMVRIMGDIAT